MKDLSDEGRHEDFSFTEKNWQRKKKLFRFQYHSHKWGLHNI